MSEEQKPETPQTGNVGAAPASEDVIVNMACRRSQDRGGGCGNMTAKKLVTPTQHIFYVCTECGAQWMIPTGGHFPY